MSLDTTYSLSVNTNNVDLLDWTLVNIPMTRPVDLRMILGDRPIHLVGYEVPRVAEGANSHPMQHLRYMFKVK